MSTVRVVVPDTGPLITLAKLHLLDALLVFKENVRIVLTDYVELRPPDVDTNLQTQWPSTSS